jgi:hypothetical protein
MNKWWGYVHANGTLQVKRYFDMQDIQEASTSPFVQSIYGPFDAVDSQHALNKLKKLKKKFTE